MSDNLPLYIDGLDDFGDLEDLDFLYSERGTRWEHARINWEAHVLQLVHENRFSTEYRMSLAAFNHLKDLLRPRLMRAANKSRSVHPVSLEVIVGIGLRYLAGGMLNDIRHVFGTSFTEAYRCVCCFLDAVNSTPELDILLPQGGRRD